MRYYETLYIVHPNLENEALEITMGEIRTELGKSKSKLINHYLWGKKRLAYQIENQKYGSFILLQFEGGDQNQMNEFNTWMTLNNSVLRHMTVALDEKPEVYIEEIKEKPVEQKAPEDTVDETSELDLENGTVAETISEETGIPSDVTDEESTEETTEETETTEDGPDESSEEDTENKEAE